MTQLQPAAIRAARSENNKLREKDFADKIGIAEAQLIAANAGVLATKVEAHPDNIMAAAQALGEVMALTRNASCVHEKIGVYDNYRSGAHAAMVLNGDIDLRFFPNHWRHAFFVEKETGDAVRRSIQVFDAAGTAVHKIFVREENAFKQWDVLRAAMALDDQSETLSVSSIVPTEAAKSNLEKLDVLRKEWARMTDTHQFMRLTSKLKMNRLGAYRIVGSPFVRALPTNAVDTVLQQVAATDIEIMIFTGNRGCIQIHSGPINTLKAMGPWQNVLDAKFNLHLRLDHISEVWAVEKPTQRGAAISVEAFDKEGAVILQIFGVGKEGRDSRPAWNELVGALPVLETTEVV